MVLKSDEFSDAYPEAFFLDLGPPNGSQNNPKSLKIASGSEKRDFVKILLFLKRQHDFQDPDAPKINKNRQKIAPRTRPRKETLFSSIIHDFGAMSLIHI